jgi:hypothetical protein
MSGRPDGNRQDNRQRGNAAQLLEKYTALARDMQLAGDRVQTEYYLQFADHYFRVLEDGRSRFEEQDQRRRRDQDEDEGSDDTVNADSDANEDEDGEEQRPAPRRDRNRQDANRQDGEARGDRPQRNDRGPRPDRDRPDRQDQPQRAERPDRQEQPQRSERPARPRRDVAPPAEGEERIAVSVLPPAIGISNDSADMDAPRPRRRVRKPRDEEGNEEIAPAA